MRTILSAENLTKVYRVGSVDVPALRGVSLEVEEGEYLAIMGPSGCGKSTMLHLLGGLLTPTTGRILIDDEDLTAAVIGLLGGALGALYPAVRAANLDAVSALAYE